MLATPNRTREANSTLRPSGMQIVLGLVLVASLIWLVAAPSAPALIFTVSTLIACIGWDNENPVDPFH
jgi:hypothetical protein